MSSIFDDATSTADYIRQKLRSPFRQPQLAIICGSGLGGLADCLEPETRTDIPYQDIPNFVVSTGHKGVLAFGHLGKQRIPTVCMVGRVHFYEGYELNEITFPIRVLKIMGAESIIITNAAGALNENYEVGDIVLLRDHINLAGLSGYHPLRGPNSDEFGLRFLALSDAFNIEMRRHVFASAKSLGISPGRIIHEGVYAFVAGPTFETRAEARMLKLLGADTVGMSTVPEIIIARHCNMRVLAMSLVTNKVVLDSGPSAHVESGGDSLSTGKAEHAEVIEEGHNASKDMQDIVIGVVNRMVFL